MDLTRGAGSAPGRQMRLPADASAAPSARAFVAEKLRTLGLDRLVDDAQLLVSELVGNAVLHARTPVTVRVTPIGHGVERELGDATCEARVPPDAVRVEVEDGSTVPPSLGLLDTQAVSGRGLMLVEALSSRRGVDVVTGAGKTVWVELSTETSEPTAELTADALLAMWADPQLDPRPGHDRGSSRGLPGAAAATSAAEAAEPAEAELDGVMVRLVDVPVEALLEAKRHVEDLVRDLQLVLLADAHDDGDTGTGGPSGRGAPAPGTLTAEMHVARRLDAAVAEFAYGRQQLRKGTLAAAASGRRRATLTLRLPRTAAVAAQRYRDALDGADALCETGRLLLPCGLREHAALRRWYLTEIITQLRAAPPAPRADASST